MKYVDETYALLCEALEIPDDIDWDSLETMLNEKEYSDMDKDEELQQQTNIPLAEAEDLKSSQGKDQKGLC